MNKNQIKRTIIGSIGDFLLFASENEKLFMSTSVKSDLKIQNFFYIDTKPKHIFNTLEEAIHFLSLDEEEK